MTPTPPGSAPLRSWAALAILVMVYMIGFTDRQILSILIVPVQRDLELTDVQISLLQGFAFASLFCTIGLFAGWAIDRFDRRLVTLVSVLFWSLSCGTCGLAVGFWSLFGARVGVGIGEGTMTPGGYSLISDLFPRHQLSLALSIYTMGANIGVGMSYLVGGSIATLAAQYGPFVFPLVGEVQAWRLTFVLLGLVGILLAPLALVFREPARRDTRAVDPGLIMPAITYATRRAALFATHFVGFGLGNAIGIIVLSWSPAYLMRVHHWSQGWTGLMLGLSVATAGVLGPLTYAQLAGRLARRGKDDFHFELPAFAALAIVFLATLSLAAPSPFVWLATIAGIYFCTSGDLVFGASALQIITPNRLRGRMVAVFGASSTVLGMGIGPFVVAYVTEHVLGDRNAVGTSQRSRPPIGCGSLSSIASAARSSTRIRSVCSTSSRPVGVRETRPPARSTSWAPVSRSRADSCCETADRVYCSARAAAAIEPSAAIERSMMSLRTSSKVSPRLTPRVADRYARLLAS
jgi:MFS family permease